MRPLMHKWASTAWQLWQYDMDPCISVDSISSIWKQSKVWWKQKWSSPISDRMTKLAKCWISHGNIYNCKPVYHGLSWVRKASNSKNMLTHAISPIYGISWMTLTLTYGLTSINGFIHNDRMIPSLWRHCPNFLELLRLNLFMPNNAASTWEQQQWLIFVPAMTDLYASGLSMDKIKPAQALSHFLYKPNQQTQYGKCGSDSYSYAIVAAPTTP